MVAHDVRFGEMALRMELVTPSELDEALANQAQAVKAGVRRRIGAWLHDAGYMDLTEVELVMQAMGKREHEARLLPQIALKQLLGRGRDGAVYRGYSFDLESEVAVKVRVPVESNSVISCERFVHEYEVVKRIRHPHVVEIYEAGSTTDFLYHVLEYVDGQSLKALISKDSALTEKQTLHVGCHLATAIICLKRVGVLHRDIKPANILVDSDGQAKLCDFGYAIEEEVVRGRKPKGYLVGSPAYMAPEYVREGNFDHRSDMYSVCMALFRCLTGRTAFGTGNSKLTLKRIAEAPLPRAKDFRSAVSFNVSNVLFHGLRKDPDLRYQEPMHLLRALQALRDHNVVLSPRAAAGYDEGVAVLH